MTQHKPTESVNSTQFPSSPSTTLDLASSPASPPDIRDLAAMISNLQAKITDLEQQVLDQKCLLKSHIKVLQAQIFDLEASNKTLSDKLTSLANSPQNWKGGSKQNRKGRSKQKGASNPSSTLPIQTQNPPSSSSSTTSNEVRPPSNSHQTPALQNSSPDSKTNFHIIWGTQKSVTADSIKACIAQAALPVPPNIDIQTTQKPSGWWHTIIADPSTISTIDENWGKIRGDSKWQLIQSLSERQSPPSCTPKSTDPVGHSISTVTTTTKPSPKSYRIVWGTRNGTKAIDIRNALCELTQVCPENVTVRRSVCPYGSKSLWWFTIISDEKTILLIEESWESICPSHEWVLIKTLKDRPRRPLSNKQSQANQGMGNILHAPRTSDEITPRTNTSAEVNPLTTTNSNSNMAPHSNSKPLNPNSSSFTPFLGPPHMIPPPNIAQLNPGFFQHP